MPDDKKDTKPNTDIQDTSSDSNAERVKNDEKPMVAYRDAETGKTKERAAETGNTPAVVYPEPTGTDGPR